MAMASIRMMSINSVSVTRDEDQDDSCSITFSRNILKLLLFYACCQESDKPPKNLSAEVFAKFRTNFLAWTKSKKLYYDGLPEDLDQFVKFIDENIYSLLEKSNIDDENKKSLSAENISNIVKKFVAKTKFNVAKATDSENSISKRKRSLPEKLRAYSLSKRRKVIKEEEPLGNEEEIIDDHIDEDYVPEIPVDSEISENYEGQESDLDYNSEDENSELAHETETASKEVVTQKTKSPKKNSEKDFEWVPAKYGKYNFYKKFGTEVRHSMIYRRCVECDYQTTFYQTFASHMMQVHQEIIKYECNNCDNAFKIIEEYAAHKKSCCCRPQDFELVRAKFGTYNFYKKFGTEGKYSRTIRCCPECNYQSSIYKTFANHMLVEHQKVIDYECNKCDSVFKTLKKYLHHKTLQKCSHHDDEGAAARKKEKNSEKSLEFEWVPAKFGSYNYYKKVGTEVNYATTYRRCLECDYHSNTYKNFANHMIIVHKEVIKYECSNCSNVFKTMNKYQHHKSQQKCSLHHGERAPAKKKLKKNSEKSLDFEWVPAAFGSYNFYKKFGTEVRHSTIYRRCVECDYQSNTYNHFANHMLFVHQEVIDYECNNCDSVFKTIKEYLNHKNQKNCSHHDNELGPAERTLKENSEKSLLDYEWVPAKYGKYNFYKKFGTEVRYTMIYRRCVKCDYQTNIYKNFANHMMSVHEEEVDYECNNCDSVFTTIEEYLKHKNKKKCSHRDNEWGPAGRTRQKSLDYEWVPAKYGKYNFYKKFGTEVRYSMIYRRCVECNYQTNIYKNFVRHMMSVHQEVVDYECNNCDSVFKTIEEYLNHKNKKKCPHRDMRDELYQQTDIGHEISRTKCQFKDYIYLVNYSSGRVKPLYVCSQCSDWQSHSILEHSIHCRNVHGNSGYEFACSDCEFNSRIYIEFKRHRFSHGDSTTFQCDSCNYVARNWAVLSTHAKRHTRGPGNPHRYLCDQCGKAFATHSCMVQHKASHSAVPKYKCSLPNCDFKTNFSQVIKHHEYTHTLSEDQYKCMSCDYSSQNLADLRRHVRIHLGMMEFKCPECDFMAYDQHTVRRHLSKQHTKVAEFVCNICGVTTSKANGLRIHMMNHEGVKPFKCSICGFQSALRYQVRQHIVRLHPGQNGVCLDTGVRLDYDIKKTNNLHEDKVMRVIYGLKDTTESDQSLQLFVKEIRKATDKEVVTLRCDECPYVNRSSNAFLVHKLTAHVEGIQLPPITDPTRVSDSTLKQRRKCKSNDVLVRKLSENYSVKTVIESVADQTVEIDEQLVNFSDEEEYLE